MSLFKAREWWRAQCGSGEEFDGACLCVGNLDNDPQESVKLAVGSLQGFLRIYQPRSRDYRPEDLLLEQELEQAILQLEVGHFSAAGGFQLAVLHPRKLVVYGVQNVGAQYLQLNKLYEHYMEHTAANMCLGRFGGSQGSDYLCVQSYDGQLSFFECETFAFSRYLPGFLVPGPIAYIEPADVIVTCSASFEVECYRYKSLAAASGEKQDPQEKKPGAMAVGKRLVADWKVLLGESAVDIRCGRLTQGLQSFQADVVVLCEHHVFVLSSMTGSILFQKRLEYHPACCTTYPASNSKLPGGPENLLVSSHNKALHVYRGNVLCWAARMDCQPVAVFVTDILTGTGPQGLLRGMIVTLDDGGGLLVSYLGTDPMLNPVGFVEGKEMDFEAMGQEQRTLATIIREHAAGKRVEPPDRLVIRPHVPAVFDSSRGAGFSSMSRGGAMSGGGGLDEDEDGEGGEAGGGGGSLGSSGGGRKVTVKLYLVYQGGGVSMDDVTLTVRAPEPVSLAKTSYTIPEVQSDHGDPTIIPLAFRAASATCLPASNTALVLASFCANSGEPRAQQLEVVLPMCLFATIIPPVKNAAYKITVAVNRSPPQLSVIFEDMLAQASPGAALAATSGAAGANVLSFQFPTGVDVTIIVSKNGGRYRLQSDAFEAMWLILDELARRLTAYYEQAEGEGGGGGESMGGPVQVTYDEPLPLEDFMEAVDGHFGVRQELVKLRQQLEDRAIALRSIQKRLLMRFKDKAPSSLNQLDFLEEETYSALMALGSSVDGAQQRLKKAAQKLSASVQLMLLLINFKFGLNQEEASVMKSALSAEVLDGDEIGWEESTEAAMTQLLKSALARSAKEAAVPLPPLVAAKDTVKLKKHLSLVLERLSKGQKMALEGGDLGVSAQGSGATSGPSLARQISRAASSRV